MQRESLSENLWTYYNVFSLECDCDTLCAIVGAVAEEFYHGTGLKDDEILRHYLDDRLYEI